MKQRQNSVLQFVVHRRGIRGTAVVSEPMALDLWADDDGRYSTAASAPIDPAKPRPPATVLISKYRGPGAVIFGDARPKLEILSGGKPDEPYSGKTTTTVTFGQLGDYLLHVTANDYSGNGGVVRCAAGRPP